MIGYLLFTIFFSYFIISIIKKELPLGNYVYEGKRAVFLSVFFIILFIPSLYTNIIAHVDVLKSLISFIIGIPFTVAIHKLFLIGKTIVPEKITQRKITTSNLILYGILGVFVGFITGMLALSIGGILGLSFYMACIFAIIIFIVTIVKVAKWGARTPFGGYDLLGMAKKEDEEKIKNILDSNNILYFTKPILRKEFLNSKRFRKYNKDNKILIPNNDNELIKILINEGYYDKAEDLLGNLLDTNSVWYL